MSGRAKPGSLRDGTRFLEVRNVAKLLLGRPDEGVWAYVFVSGLKISP
jgi:hypothetical protein